MLWLLLALLFFFGFVLVKATDIVLEALRKLVVALKINPFGAASFILAFSTSLPELTVAIAATMKNQGDLVLGNVLGSNIADMSLVLGGAAMVSGVLRATSSFLKREVMYVFLAGSFPLLLLMDGRLSRLDGTVLLAVYLLYNMTVLERKRIRMAEHEVEEEPWWERMLVKIAKPRVEKSMGMLALGVGLLIIAADMVVRLSGALARLLQVPELIIGLFIVAIGTSLPELAFEIRAIAKREVQMAFGNILGSVVANSTGILGITAIVAPFALSKGLPPYLLATLAFVIIFFVFWGLVWTKHRLERWEGAVLFGLYITFTVIELSRLAH